MVGTKTVGEKLYANFTQTIENYGLLEGVDSLVYLFSGGKDATIGIDFLQRYLADYGRNIDLNVVMVTYPKHVYYLEDGSNAQCYIDTVNYWRSRKIDITIFDPEVDDFEDSATDACKVCKSARKQCVDFFLEKFQQENSGKKVGVVTGYTLYDALAYMDEILLVSNFQKYDYHAADEKIKIRINNCLHKMKAREKLPNGLVVIRPLINMWENEIMDYVTGEGIPYVSRGCKAAKDKHKREYFKVLNVAAPINHTDYDGLLAFLQKMGIDFPTDFADIQLGNFFTDC